MIKAIIFDCFGVLTTDGWEPFKDVNFKNDTEARDEAGRILSLANRGKISYQQMLSMLSKLSDIPPSIIDSQLSMNHANLALYKYIESKLKPKYKIGLLSNVSRDRLHDLFSDDQLGLLDEVVLSYEIGAIKPDARAYIVAAERIGYMPEECVFIDDRDYFVRGAQNVGMYGIQYKDFEFMKIELEKILEVSNTNK